MLLYSAGRLMQLKTSFKNPFVVRSTRKGFCFFYQENAKRKANNQLYFVQVDVCSFVLMFASLC